MICLRLCLVMLLLFSFLLQTAAADSIPPHAGPYLGVSVALLRPDTIKAEDMLGRYNLKSDSGTALGLTLGYDLTEGGPLGEGRVELEYQQWQNDITRAEFSDGTFNAQGRLKGSRLLLNSFARFTNRTRFTPYVGVGLGVAKLQLEQLTVDAKSLINDESLVLAGQAGCGIGLDLFKHLRLDLGYRFFTSADSTFSDVDGRKVKLNLNAHSLLLGVAYLF